MDSVSIDEGNFDFLFVGQQRPAPLALPLVMAHYLPWFTLRGGDWPLPAKDLATISSQPAIGDFRHWTDPGSGYARSHLQVPEIGRYDSRDPEVIRWQIQAAQSAGIDGFVINWYGRNSVENIITLHFLNALEQWNIENPERPFFYQLCLDTQAQLPTEGKKPVPLVEDFAYVRDHLIRDGCLLRGHRPVFLCFSYNVSVPEWVAAASLVFGEDGYDLLWSDPCASAEVSGHYLWVAPDRAAGANADPLYTWPDPSDIGAKRAARAYDTWAASGHPYGMAGVWPGFNDSLVTWAWSCPAGGGRRRPRVMAPEIEEGCTYDLLWQAYHRALGGVAGAGLPLVQIVTWNDHAETTAIEPTREFGDRYLKKTRAHVEKARALWRECHAVAAVAAPMLVSA